MYIVLPLFFVCYGGSCIAFSVYKIYLNCFTNASESCKPSNPSKIHHEFSSSKLVPFNKSPASSIGDMQFVSSISKKQIFHILQSDDTLNNEASKANVTSSGSSSKVTFYQPHLISPLEIPKNQISSTPIMKIRHNTCHSKSISEILRKKMTREIDKKKFKLLINHRL